MGLYPTARCIGGRYEFPFRDVGDSVTRVYSLDCVVDALSYAPIADDTTFDDAASAGVDRLPDGMPTDSAAYYVGDADFNQQGYLLYFKRRFANVPLQRTTPAGFHPFTFPVIGVGQAFSALTLSTQTDYRPGDFELVLNCELATFDAERFDTGDFASVFNPARWQYNWGSNGQNTTTTSTFNGNVIVLDSSNIEVRVPNLYWTLSGSRRPYENFQNLGSSAWSVTKTITGGRNAPETINAPAWIVYRYFRGETLGRTLARRFELFEDTGERVDATTETTVPYTTVEYGQLVEEGGLLRGEDEVINRWMGNIFEVSQIWVRAL